MVDTAFLEAVAKIGKKPSIGGSSVPCPHDWRDDPWKHL